MAHFLGFILMMTRSGHIGRPGKGWTILQVGPSPYGEVGKFTMMEQGKMAKANGSRLKCDQMAGMGK